MPTLIIIGLMVIPYIDENPLGNGYYTYKQRKFAIWTYFVGFLGLWLTMIAIGTLIRGPGWQWFWPSQTWDHNRLIFEVNRDLHTIVGITSPVGAGIFGAVIVGAYFVVMGYLAHKLCMATAFTRRIYARMSLTQTTILQGLLVLMASLPIKMVLRHLFRIKYVWVTPWFNI